MTNWDRKNEDWCFWNWHCSTLVTDLFLSNDISRNYWFIFNYKFCIKIIQYNFNVSLIIVFNWVSNSKISPLDNLSILTYFFRALYMLLTAHTKRLNVPGFIFFSSEMPHVIMFTFSIIFKNVSNFPNDIQY